MTTSPGAPLEVLERRLFFARRHMNASQFVLNLDDALSVYRLTQPPQFLWDPRLNAEARTLAGVHEMVHAVLHPPGSAPVGENESPVEERIAHYVAGQACTLFEVTSYADFVEHWQLHPSHIEDDEQVGAELLLNALVETLESPDDPPAWLGRDNCSFSITSLERAWASTI